MSILYPDTYNQLFDFVKNGRGVVGTFKNSDVFLYTLKIAPLLLGDLTR